MNAYLWVLRYGMGGLNTGRNMYVLTYIHTYTHTCIHTYIHTHTHIHKSHVTLLHLPPSSSPGASSPPPPRRRSGAAIACPGCWLPRRRGPRKNAGPSVGGNGRARSLGLFIFCFVSSSCIRKTVAGNPLPAGGTGGKLRGRPEQTGGGTRKSLGPASCSHVPTTGASHSIHAQHTPGSRAWERFSCVRVCVCVCVCVAAWTCARH